MRSILLASCLAAAAVIPLRAADTLANLVRIVGNTPDTQLRLDVLRGLRDAVQGRSRVAMPAGWEGVEGPLLRNEQPEIRSLARSLGLAFGSAAALDATRNVVEDRAADSAQRQEALRALVAVRDTGIAERLRALLADNTMRAAAIRGLAAFDDPATAPALLAAYPTLAGNERRDALATLAARPADARALLLSVDAGTVSSKDLTADLIRQLRNLKDDQVNTVLTRVYGSVREVGADKQAEIEKYKRLYWAGGSQPGDAIRGRAVYAKVCQQCHILFDVGGKVGPDLTGSNRGDLDYLLQNILDPNAVIPNEYRASTLDLKDGRVITGIVKKQDDRALTVATATETIQLPRGDVADMTESQLSMMPEGLVASIADQDYRDLIYYLGRLGQTPMLATADTAGLFFNGTDLSLWHGDESLWSVANGEIVGRTKTGLKTNSFLANDLILGDFRLVVEIRLTPDSENSGIQFRSEPLADGGVKGYQADVGAGWWGKLYEEHGRALLWDRPGDAFVKTGEWNTYEIVAVGSRIRTAINGKPCVDLDDPSGARQGIVAFQLHAGGPLEVRFRNLRLELNPEPNLVTAGR